MPPIRRLPRWARVIAFFACATLFVATWGWWRTPPRPEKLPPSPTKEATLSDAEAVALLGHPTFRDAWEHERQLPQHSVPSRVKGPSPRYLRLPHASWGSGWNNVFQEQLLNAHLAQLSDRAYVFPAYIPRDHVPFPDTLPNGTRHMLHVPMNAFVAGPIAGGGDGSMPLSRRGVSDAWWETVCLRKNVKVLNVYDEQRRFGYDTEHAPVVEVMVRWAEKLRTMQDSCVSLEETSVFNYVLAGSRGVLSVWPAYGASALLSQFAWSPLVASAIFHNFNIIVPPSTPIPTYLRPLSTEFQSITTSNPYTLFAPLNVRVPPISGLLGIHVRRGDYAGHCNFLADINASYNAWANFGEPEIIVNSDRNARKWLADGEAVTASAEWPRIADYRTLPANANKTETRDALFRHCYPDIDTIVAKAARVRSESPRQLRSIYIATNGEQGFVANLIDALRSDGWAHAASSLDLDLYLGGLERGKEVRAVSQAVDMGVLSVLADEFIGVGFSSLTSNVVQIRLGAGRNGTEIHFW
ncbi:SH3 and PX-domain-containing 3 [Mycena kentingensis (nom. inval.)]|nr:SH3 and PX-domain-containing 3 [Mycena kentingensis (nom. inval.)]